MSDKPKFMLVSKRDEKEVTLLINSDLTTDEYVQAWKELAFRVFGYATADIKGDWRMEVNVKYEEGKGNEPEKWQGFPFS